MAPSEYGFLAPPTVGRATRIFAAVTLGPFFALVVFLLLHSHRGSAAATLGATVTLLLFVLPAVLLPARGKRGLLRVNDDELVLEIGRSHQRIALTTLDHVAMQGDALVLVLGDSSIALRSAYFGTTEESTETCARIVDDIAARIRGHAEKGAIEERFAAFENLHQQLYGPGTSALVVYAVLTCMAVGFGLELFTGALSSGEALLRLGANLGRLVAAGQYDRLIVANFLHAGVLHVAMNASALVSFGAIYERWYGRARLGVVLFASGVCGQLVAAVATPDSMVVGVSTALYGLLGAAAVTSFWYRHRRLDGPRIAPGNWLSLLLVNGVISLLPGVSLAGHAGGLIAGAAVAWFVFPPPDRPPRVSDRVVAQLALVCVVVTIWAIARVALRAMS